jgi:hypothetical protein
LNKRKRERRHRLKEQLAAEPHKLHGFCDGSACEREGQLPSFGIGFIVVKNGIPVRVHSEKLNLLPNIKDFALVSEIHAAQRMLLALPEGSWVVVHSDHRDIRNYINSIGCRQQISKKQDPLSDLYTKLAKAIKRHRHVVASSQTLSKKYSDVAHLLAVDGSGAGKRARAKAGYITDMDMICIKATAAANGHMLHCA